MRLGPARSPLGTHPHSSHDCAEMMLDYPLVARPSSPLSDLVSPNPRSLGIGSDIVAPRPRPHAGPWAHGAHRPNPAHLECRATARAGTRAGNRSGGMRAR
eukprot:793562-Pyramimonas_sp.AAC.1